MNLPFKIDLSGKVAVVTGAGGILCSSMAEALAKCGAKVALLDLNEEAAKQSAETITAQGGIARGYQANVLEKGSLEEAHKKISKELGDCDILINGAGGNHPRATTDKEYFSMEDLKEDVKTFFDLEQGAGVCPRYGRTERMQYLKYIIHERVYAVDKDPGVQRSQGGGQQFYTVACRAFCRRGNPRQCFGAGIFCDKPE